MVENVIDQINKLFHAQSIAFFGVSSKKGKLGNLLMQSFFDIEYEGELIPIHPYAEKVMSLRAYPNLEAYGEIDLAIISLHPSKVFSAVKDCIENGKAKGIVIFSSGFSEYGNEGKQLEKKIVDYARLHGTRIIGPNCMGLFSPSTKISFFPGLPSKPGNVAFVSHSGSLAVHLAFAASFRGIFFSKIISCGNGADLDLPDFFEYLGQDPETKVIACYVEGIKDGNRFLRIARQVSQKKPIIMWKVGETPGGRSAAQSHTGAIIGNSDLLKNVSDQAGIIRVNNLNEIIGHIGTFINPYLPKGNRVAIISGPGGPAVSSADACEKVGLQLTSFTPETEQTVAKIIPKFGTSVKNPVDLSLAIAFESALNYKAAEIVGKDENVDSILIYISTLQKQTIKGLLQVQEQIRKPIALITSIDPIWSLEGAEDIKNFLNPIRPRKLRKILQNLYQNGISLHLTEQDAAKALAALWKYNKYLYYNSYSKLSNSQ
ncbi:MAG: acetate--CoA ligase family protein [Promethearchaeota archaeon]